jgi:hypothetical protein
MKSGPIWPHVAVAALVAMTVLSCARRKSPNALTIAMRGVNLVLTATTPVTIERLVLNAHTGDGRCDSAAPPPVKAQGEFDREVHRVPVSLRTGDRVSFRWHPACGAIYKAEVTTDQGVYNLNFIGE